MKLLSPIAHHNHDKFEIFAFAELENEDKFQKINPKSLDTWNKQTMKKIWWI